jgi:NDP-sugar pyrophosphorylase family protein
MVPRETFSTKHYINIENLWFKSIFSTVESPWELLQPKLKEEWIVANSTFNASKIETHDGLVLKTQKIPTKNGFFTVISGSYIASQDIEFHANVVVEPGAYIHGPAVFGEGTVIRQGAYVRGGVITGRNCVVGHTTEVKSSIFCDEAKAGHFAYIGDSILGNDVNLGAGTKISNLKMTNDEIVLRIDTEVVKTGLRKMGAIIGDGCETGCNSVLNPGVLLAPHCMVYPAIAVRKKYYAPKTTVRE